MSTDVVDNDLDDFVDPLPPVIPQGEFEQPIYKEWFKSSKAAGFISITPWLTGKDGSSVGKLIVDIGSLDNQNKVISNTKCYVNAIDLAVYMRSVVSKDAAALYPKRTGTHSAESFVVFGGTAKENPIARVFKIEHWGANKDSEGQDSAFVWKCGHFKGKVQNSGAIMPDYANPLSGDMIRRTRAEMHIISYRIDLALTSWVANHPKWNES